MRTKLFISMFAIAAFVATFGLNEATAGFPAPPGLPAPPRPNVNVQVNGYLPAPPGVHVMIDSGRPYYVEREQRVYIERERPDKHHKKYKKYKKEKKEKKHHEDEGRHKGHYK